MAEFVDRTRIDIAQAEVSIVEMQLGKKRNEIRRMEIDDELSRLAEADTVIDLNIAQKISRIEELRVNQAAIAERIKKETEQKTVEE